MNSFEKLIRKNKQVSLSVALGIAGVFMILFVIFPQFSAIGETRVALEEKQEKVEVLRKSNELLTSQSDDAINENFAAADSALPSTKNIVGIFTVLSEVASTTEVQLDSFTLEVGNLYLKEGKKKEAEITSVQGVPVLSVALKVNSNSHADLVNFAELLYASLPLAEIKTINMLNNAGDFEINFFYKPYNIQDLSSVEEIKPLDAQAEQALKTINEWKLSNR